MTNNAAGFSSTSNATDSEQRPIVEVANEVASLIASAPAVRLEAEAALAAFMQSVGPPEQTRHEAEVKRLEAVRATRRAEVDGKAKIGRASCRERV